MSLDALLAPPLAFAIYLGLVWLLNRFGQMLATEGEASVAKSSTYSSGEAAPTRPAAPGYKSFFVIALFFAVLHLGVLIVATGQFSAVTAVYLVGLGFALLALILG